MGNKIILLLSILMLSFFGTAIVIRSMVTETSMLTYDAETISTNIHHKETMIENLFEDSMTMKIFRNVERYPTQVLEITRKQYEDNFVFLFIYKNDVPIFWSNNLITPPTLERFNQETVFVEYDTRSYVLKQKEVDSETTILAIIPIKRNFDYSNEYLTNKFYQGIIETNNLDIANYADTKVIRNIYSKDGSFLFSVKFKEGKYHNIFLLLQFLFWILGGGIFLILFNYWSVQLAKNGHAWPSVILMLVVLAILRTISMKTNWIADTSSLGLFDPKYYAYNPFLPNLWEFITMTMSTVWIVFYTLSIQKYLIIQNKVKPGIQAITLSTIALASIYLIGYFLFQHLSSLITHTPNVNMDFTNILGFSTYSWVNIFIFCLNMVILLFYIDLTVEHVRTMVDNLTVEINLQLIVLIVFLFISVIFFENALFYTLIVGAIILIRAYTNHKYSQYHFVSFALTLLLSSLLSSIIYNRSIRIEQIKEMTLTLNYLEAENDLNALSLFMDVENNIKKDTTLKRLLADNHIHDKDHIISNHIKLNYLDGYLSKYEQQFYYYFNGEPLIPYRNNKLIEYREKVINNSTRIPQTEHFYRVRSELGTHEYFFQLEIPLDGEENVAQLFINLKNRSYSPSLPYPEILSENKVDLIREHYSSNASFALYKDHTLLTQHGKYIYPTDDNQYPQNLNEHIRLSDDNGFFHMMIRPDIHTAIITSKPLLSLWQSLAIISFLFLSLFVVYIFAKGILHIITTISSRSFSLRMLQFQLIVLRNKIRYSTRIQTMVIVVVILAILISGTIVFFTIRKQLDKNNLDLLENQITETTKKIENIISAPGQHITLETTSNKIQDLNELSSLDINVFDKNGQLVYTSQPRIYELGLLSTYMNPYAYNELNVIKKAGTSIIERIGDFEYNSSYATIRNDDYNTVAFINIPNYASKKEEIRSSNLLLNSLLNIYTIIILTAGFLAVFVSRKITKPLAIIGQKLAETNVDHQNNEPIYWERDDEIGSLIKEYNLMLIKMEESTKQLMNAEREYAWREMARQVAHEIKNPLTPMKLGVQQLMRSFREGDPRFEERFNKFSTSFIDQINSLSKIAVEFSNFAKLPNTQLTKIDILLKITKVVNLFTSSPNTYINIVNNTDSEKLFVFGDRDQLLRTFNNLIKNAIESARGRKKMHISITLDYVDTDKLKISIKDNGLGIPQDVIPKIFQPNFTTKSSGTGLGLAFVKKTIESMKGDITFATFENVGTTFTIILPIYNESDREGNGIESTSS